MTSGLLFSSWHTIGTQEMLKYFGLLGVQCRRENCEAMRMFVNGEFIGKD